MTGKATRSVQWGAVATALGICFGIATYYGCVPVLRSQLDAHEIREDNKIDDVQHELKHIHEDELKLLDHFSIVHKEDEK